jgi:hypothetical protein
MGKITLPKAPYFSCTIATIIKLVKQIHWIGGRGDVYTIHVKQGLKTANNFGNTGTGGPGSIKIDHANKINRKKTDLGCNSGKFSGKTIVSLTGSSVCYHALATELLKLVRLISKNHRA